LPYRDYRRAVAQIDNHVFLDQFLSVLSPSTRQHHPSTKGLPVRFARNRGGVRSHQSDPLSGPIHHAPARFPFRLKPHNPPDVPSLRRTWKMSSERTHPRFHSHPHGPGAVWHIREIFPRSHHASTLSLPSAWLSPSRTTKNPPLGGNWGSRIRVYRGGHSSVIECS
jgi:hypothetical protein